MSAVIAVLASHSWLAIAAALGAFLLLFAVLHVYARTGAAGAEATRKMFHAGSGCLTLTFPFLFHEIWPVLLLTAASALFIAVTKFQPAARARLGGVTDRVDRTTLGELYFPLSVALVFWLAHDEHPLLFVIPILMLTFADATCALVGRRYGLTPYEGASKSLEGSIAFVVVAFFCVHVPLVLWSDVRPAESLLIATTLALLVMVLEGSAWHGLDNLFIPIGGYFLLRAYLPMDAAALTGRLLVTVALVLVVVLARRRTTLEDDALAAGVFLCYVAWAVKGWPWLVGPFAMLVGYRWLSPATADNSRRMHDVPAVLSVWAAALFWLSAPDAGRPGQFLLPYTIVFAAHLAIFGISRLAYQFRNEPLAPLLARAVTVSWAVVMIPFVAATGLDTRHVVITVAAVVAIAAGAIVFVSTEPRIRATSQDAARWIRQAVCAGLASVLAWGLDRIAGGFGV